MDEICVAKFDVYECRKSDRASALGGAQLNICAAQTPEFPDTIPTIPVIKRGIQTFYRSFENSNAFPQIGRRVDPLDPLCKNDRHPDGSRQV